MKYVKLTSAVGSRGIGEVLHVDDASAKSLVEKKQVGVYFDPDSESAEEVRSAPRLGNTVVHQVVEDQPPADQPPADSAAEDDSDGEGQADDSGPEGSDGDEQPEEPPAAKPKGRPRSSKAPQA